MIDSENTAHIRELTPEISTAGKHFRDACESLGKQVKLTGGGCGTLFFLTEFTDAQEYVMFKLTLADGADLRELAPNEYLYKRMDLPTNSAGRIIEEDDDDDDDDSWDDDWYES